MRIITGRARGAKLQAPEGQTTRPTAERTKEAVFSMLQGCFEGGLVLDLFAGSGQMGLEAVSRGASSAILVDSDKAALAAVRQNAEHTKLAPFVRVVAGEALAFLRSYRGEPFSLVLLDPPYGKGLVSQCLTLLSEGGLLSPAATVVCETGNGEEVFGGNGALASRFTVLRSTRYGVAHITLLAPSSDGKEVAP